MLKKFLMISLLMLVITGLIACGDESDNSEGDSAPSTGEERVLKVSYPTWWEEWFFDLRDEFEAENEGVTVELIPLHDDVTTKQAMMMQSADTSPDVAVEDTFIINSDVNAGYLSPMDDILNDWDEWDKFEETTKQGVTAAADGKIYGVPFSTDVQGLWYNKVLFEEAGLPVPFEPQSWEELLNAAEVIKENTGDVIPLFTYVTKATGEATSMRTFQVLYSGTGSSLYDFDENKWVVDETALTDTFEFIDSVFQNDLGPSLSVASNSQVATLLSEDLMMNNKVSMVIDGNWVAASWREGRATPWPEALDTWGFTLIPTQFGQEPGFTSMSGGWALSIPAHASEKDLAAEFIKMAVNEQQQFDYVRRTGDMTVRTDVAVKEEYLDQPISNYREAAEMLSYTNFRPAVDDYPTVSTFIQEVVESVASGQSSPDQAVQEFENGLKRIVGEENVINK
ncbi:extracellular solute-binding protein [Evansella tamaricis]|uniref:Extracellular solute-binding protein n=1 Tax=Evansella tamaricis TaxID=2069301 RepID=A0ABS6JH51_9BACI|nr:extracellular solute-binding protein [Evansella tamaricis]MBU9711668.1 extracellular solute-binding protein [Evansella tamaricis]